jgi:uncharacterized protein (DUF1778 family)
MPQDNSEPLPQQPLADQVHFVLPPERWEAFCQALDAPPRESPALKRLLTRESVFDGHGESVTQ